MISLLGAIIDRLKENTNTQAADVYTYYIPICPYGGPGRDAFV
jgi:hypothetical protein